MCDEPVTLDQVNFDHIVSDKILRDQGIKSNTDDNCQVLCQPCHVNYKTPKDMAEIVKRRKQNKKHGDAAGKGKRGKSFPRPEENENLWKSRGFEKPKNYKTNWPKRKFNK